MMNDLSYQEFIRIIDELYDEVIVYDNNYKIIYINKACERHYGMTKEEMMGSSFFDYADEYWSTSVLPFVYKTKKTVKQKQETKLGAKILTIAIPIFDEQNEVQYVAMSVRDDIPDDESQDVFILDKVKETANLKFENKILTTSNKMEKVLHLADQIVNVDAPCLITGESGVGKTLIGKYIHEHSSRKEKSFVHINCAAISKDIVESELFGYTKGSFTGASRGGKKGLASEADGGILFLDEISEIPYKLQAKLLQFIQEKKFYPVGSTKPISVDVKIIAATNKDLKKMVEMGSFREDLYYRLNVFEIQIPPLRERKEDILILCDFYLNKYNQKYNKTHRLSEEVKHILNNYSWKGNIRELANIMERLTVVTKDIEIKPWHLPKHLYELPVKEELKCTEINIDDGKTLNEMLEEYEKRIVERAYEELNSSRKVSEKLGISQTKASRLFRKYVK
ncbi:sigma-54 interaction domain-containing protein [Oceanirhabdus sp. W0125-5]|uniref:sigma-54 interaction domain-containing protein n=1 Tax=Oceanirhabdus sp. W0125-5 TaxID=2999116 RepID=UPI0022F2E5C2|nr:sigma 54-interacting transcriptional regulator [Oceanirhabdus sp. W0125-5]WBW96465.1 sigma 54-interacting transcriptional regulator [Oceanirhabdus sp. W0125-5]